MDADSIRAHKRPGGIGIFGTIVAADAKQHQFSLILELQANPVPPDLIGFELLREKLMIHPCETRNIESISAKLDLTARSEAGQRKIMGSASCSCSFLADAMLALNHHRLVRPKRKLQPESVVNRLQLLFGLRQLNFPITAPDAAVC